METSIRGFNLNEASCTMDSEKADITMKPTFADHWLTESKVLPSPPNRQPVPWQLKQTAPATGSSYSRIREMQLGLGMDLLAARGKRSAGDGGDGRHKEGK